MQIAYCHQGKGQWVSPNKRPRQTMLDARYRRPWRITVRIEHVTILDRPLAGEKAGIHVVTLAKEHQ
jgi:hypothetical protein